MQYLDNNEKEYLKVNQKELKVREVNGD